MFTTRQLTFGIAAFIGGSSLFTVFVSQITLQDSWITALLALAASLLTIWMYTGLISRFPGRGLLEMHTEVYGKQIGLLLNFLYVLFCIGFAAVSLRNLGDFFSSYIMPETPMLVVLILFALTCALAAGQGIGTVLRLSFLLFTFMFLALLLNCFLLIKNMELSNFLPILRLGLDTYAKGSFVLTAAPFCEIVIFLILLPYADRKTNVKKSFFQGLLLGALHLMITFLRDIAVLGSSLAFLTEPTYEAVRRIHILDVFSRLEIIFAFVLIVMRVFKLSILFCAILRAVEDTVGRTFQRRRTVLIFVATLAVIAALFGFRTGMTLPEWFRNTGAYFFGFFEIVLPLITLIVAAIRRLGCRKM
ncbi:MAG: hypothetical protein E7390_05495 [Ruminococcaceae bacterium]|nr:hypothetical protein [Oscillospiraceae bacterium]